MPIKPPSDRLEGELVVLRAKRFSDVDRDYTWRSDPELAELDATSPIRLSIDEYSRHYRDELDFPSPWSVRYAIETRIDARHIGNAMYYDIDRTKGQCELGIMIGNREFWSRGYGTDAVVTLVRGIFEETGLERVYLHTLDYNTRAQKAFRKAGFHDLRQVRRERRNFLMMEAFRDAWLDEFGERPRTDGAISGDGHAPGEHSGPGAARGATGAADPT